MTTLVTDDPVLKRFRAELDHAYGGRIERVVLFGSRARGDHREDSDYDIAVFIRDFGSHWQEVQRLTDVKLENLGDAAFLVSAIPFPAGSIEQRTPIMHEIRKDGIEL